MTGAVVGDQRQRSADVAVNFEGDRTLEMNLAIGKTRAHVAIERGIVGFPQSLPRTYPAPIDIAVAEAESRFAVAGLELVDASAFFALLRFSGVEHHPVARF